MPETGDDLVKDEDHAVFGGDGPQRSQEVVGRPHRSNVVTDRFDDDGGDRPRVAPYVGLHRVSVVVRKYHGFRSRLTQHAGGNGVVATDSLARRLHIHRDVVVPTVIAALELDDALCAGRGARKPQRVIRRLGAARAECDLFGTGNAADQSFRGLDFKVEDAGTYEVDALGGLGDTSADCRVAVSENVRAKPAMEVDVLVAVSVVEIRSFSPNESVGKSKSATGAVKEALVTDRVIARSSFEHFTRHQFDARRIESIVTV